MKQRNRLSFLQSWSLIFLLNIVTIGMTMRDAQGKSADEYTAQLSFLSSSSRQDLSWLLKTLEEKGFQRSKYSLRPSTLFPSQQELVTSNLNLIKTVNRLRAFFSGITSRPFLLFKIQESTGRALLCVTREWEKIKKDLKWDEEVVYVDSLKEEELKFCKVEGKFAPLYKNLNAAEIRKTFFEKNGSLKIGSYPSLSHDLEFIYFLITQGLYPKLGDEEGYLVIN